MAILPAAATYARHWVRPAGAALVTPVADLTTGMNFIPNPAWETARYQLSFQWHKSALKLVKPHYGATLTKAIPGDTESIRFEKGFDGNLYSVPPYIFK